MGISTRMPQNYYGTLKSHYCQSALYIYQFSNYYPPIYNLTYVLNLLSYKGLNNNCILI